MADRLPDYAQPAADRTRSVLDAQPPETRDAAEALIREGVSLGIELARGRILPGDDARNLRAAIDDVLTGDVSTTRG